MTIPTDVAGLTAWYKADAIGGLSNGDPVSQWDDSSGAANHLTSSGGARPTWQTSVQNGMAVVRFDGTDDTMADSFTLAQPCTIFCVAGIRTTVDAEYYIFDGPAGFNTMSFVYDSLDRLSMNSAGHTTQALGTTFHRFTTKFNGASGQMRLDAATISSPDTSTPSGGGIRVAARGDNGTGWSPIDFAEICVYNVAVSDANRDALETYLNDRWFVAPAGPVTPAIAAIVSVRAA